MAIVGVFSGLAQPSGPPSASHVRRRWGSAPSGHPEGHEAHSSACGGSAWRAAFPNGRGGPMRSRTHRSAGLARPDWKRGKADGAGGGYVPSRGVGRRPGKLDCRSEAGQRSRLEVSVSVGPIAVVPLVPGQAALVTVWFVLSVLRPSRPATRRQCPPQRRAAQPPAPSAAATLCSPRPDGHSAWRSGVPFSVPWHPDLPPLRTVQVLAWDLPSWTYHATAARTRVAPP